MELQETIAKARAHDMAYLRKAEAALAQAEADAASHDLALKESSKRKWKVVEIASRRGKREANTKSDTWWVD